MKAISDRVIIRLDTQEGKSIFVPQSVYNPRTTGVVISIGCDVKDIKEGDHVIFHVFDELPLIEKGLVAVRDKSILAIMEE